MRYLVLLACVVSGFLVSPAQSEFLGDEWISEQEMQRQSRFARRHNLVLADLQCKFHENIEAPGREHVLFRADFMRPPAPVAWGWTFEANGPNPLPEEQARKAGFEVVGEDYYEITGVTWVRCKLWHRLP